MISFDVRQLSDTPKLSIIFGITPDFLAQLDALERFFVEWDYLDVELVVGVIVNEPFNEQKAKNEAVKLAHSDFVAFTNAGVYPPPTLVELTSRALQEHSKGFVQGFRLDGCPDYGVFVNPFALGDWQCISKETFEMIGGYDENLNDGGGIDLDFLTRAIHAGIELMIPDERVYHAWHPGRRSDTEYLVLSAKNEEATARKGLVPCEVRFPDSPRHPKYWDYLWHDKARRIDTEVKVETCHPIAVDSPDHIHPYAVLQDNNSNPEFIKEIESLFSIRPLYVLDLGCAGGGMVMDFLKRDHVAIGLEGSDLPLSKGLFNWPQLGQKRLFTADISKPFTITINNEPARFDLITAWDVMEHLSFKDLPGVMDNIVKALKPGGLFIATIASNSSIGMIDRIEHHQSIFSQGWWVEFISKWLEPKAMDVRNSVRKDGPLVFSKGGEQ